MAMPAFFALLSNSKPSQVNIYFTKYEYLKFGILYSHLLFQLIPNIARRASGIVKLNSVLIENNTTIQQ